MHSLCMYCSFESLQTSLFVLLDSSYAYIKFKCQIMQVDDQMWLYI